MRIQTLATIGAYNHRFATSMRRFVALLLVLSFANSSAYAENAAPTPSWLQQNMSLSDARHLLGRTGFGATPERLAEMLHLTRAEAVQNIIEGLQTHTDVPMPTFVNQPAPHFWARRFMSQPDRQAFDRERDNEMTELRRWWVNNMVQTSSPQTERLVLFWHDHFATSYHGVGRRSISMARQNQLFRDNATGSYRDFLKHVIRDPAMLRYLNNTSNKKGKPNENLARELLELFTLGEGNFDEPTVKAAAKALTGNGISQTADETFQFHAYNHDFDNKTIFGQTGQFDGEALIDLILEQPEAAEHIVTRFWHAYISDEPPPRSYVDREATQFRQSDYNLRSLYSSMLRSDEFWHSSNRASMIKSPATLLIGTARSLDYPKAAWTQLPALHALLGMDLFAPPNVSGWTEGAAFVTPGKLLNRQIALKTLIDVQVDEALATSDNMMMMASEKPLQPAPLQVRVAAHLYQGAPEYRVALLDKAQETLWQSDFSRLSIGYDTEKFGEMKNRDQLAWTNVPYEAPEKLLAQSHYARVEFANDAAGKTGDRNLFVDWVSVNGAQYTSSGARQTSHCPPKNDRQAGNLYCAGDVTIDITAKHSQSVERKAPFTARNASVIWGNKNKERINTIIALEHVQTPSQYFHTLSFQVISKNENHLEIVLDNYSCNPVCVEDWPPCTVDNYGPGVKALRFTLNRSAKLKSKCSTVANLGSDYEHINSVVGSIVQSMPTLFDHFNALEFQSNDRLALVLQEWSKRIPKLEQTINKHKANGLGHVLSINPQYELPAVKLSLLPEPRLTYPSLGAYQSMLNATGLSLAQVLMGGVELDQFPLLKATAEQPIENQLETLVNHPLYQVY